MNTSEKKPHKKTTFQSPNGDLREAKNRGEKKNRKRQRERGANQNENRPHKANSCLIHAAHK